MVRYIDTLVMFFYINKMSNKKMLLSFILVSYSVIVCAQDQSQSSSIVDEYKDKRSVYELKKSKIKNIDINKIDISLIGGNYSRLINDFKLQKEGLPTYQEQQDYYEKTGQPHPAFLNRNDEIMKSKVNNLK